MRTAARVGRWCVAVFLLSLAATAAADARRPITGKLSSPGYTVIALADNGKARSVRAGARLFRVVPPAERVTLHLRAAGGKYAGPIVAGVRRGRAVVGFRAGAQLGTIAVRRGYARVVRRLPGRAVDVARLARARRGVPIGARVFGRVRSRPPRGSPSADRDVDGVPDPLDIDDDGDRILDSFDGSRAVRASQGNDDVFDIQTSLGVDLEYTANANVPGLTAEQIEAALPSFGRLDVEVLAGDSTELDCGRAQSRTDPGVGGLIYCSRGGTGTLNRYEDPPYPKFPECCDADGDGFGRLFNTGNSPEGTPFMFLFPGATSAQIGTGDLLIARVTRASVETQFAATLGYAFATVPALVSFSDGQGTSVTVSYPVAKPAPGTAIGGGPGTRENPFSVAARSGGDVVLTLTFWRPQRRPIPPETGEWIDVGRLNYGVGFDESGKGCPQNAFSEDDPSLARPTTQIPIGANAGGFTDLVADRLANRANTLTYTVNLTRCAESNGSSLKPGEQRSFGFAGLAPASGDDATQTVFFKRQ